MERHTLGTAGVDLEPIKYGKPWISDTSNNNCITRVAGLTAPRYLTC
jgi:hypothetical protein